MFRGIAATTLDAKGRITLPTRYRQGLDDACGGHLMLTADGDGCVLIYPLPEWDRFEAQLMALPNAGNNSQVRGMHRLYVGHARACEIDGQFRISIPSELRAFADLEKNVCLVGQGKKFELWSDEKWRANHAQWLQEEKNLADGESILDQIII